MRIDRIFAVAFVVLISTAIVGVSTGDTGANFTATTTNPGQSWATANVVAPASESATSAIAGRIDLAWPATTTPANGHTVTYLVFRDGAQIGTTGSLTYSDTPPADGTYTYAVQTKIAQGAGSFTSGNSPAQSPKSDRTAPTMSATCNGVACTSGWYTATVAAVVSGNDGAGVGMGTATYKIDAGAPSTVAAPASFDVSGDSVGHSVVFSGADAVGNASGNSTVTIKIDGTAPTTPTFSAAAGALLGPTTTDFSWTAATDATSGVKDYTLRWVQANTPCPAASPANYPNVVANIAGTSYPLTGNLLTTYCGYVVAFDNAGNASGNSNAAGAQAQ